MGTIIRMSSKELYNDFLPNIDDHKDFQFIPISSNVTTNGKHANVKALPRLIPPSEAMNMFIQNDDKKTYKKMYYNYLSSSSIEAFLAIIVKAVVDNDIKVVLVCSEFETDFNYLKHLCDYIEEVFLLDTYTVKSYFKDVDKASKVKDPEKVKEILDKKLKKLENSGISLHTEKSEKDIYKELKKHKKKDLKKLAKKNKVKLKKDMSKKDMAKKLSKVKSVF